MSETIVVVDSKIISNLFKENSKEVIQACEKDILQVISDNHKLIKRDIAEKDNTYKQMISYCLIKYEDEIFMTRRTKKQTESRLHNMYSVGVGGHISVSDIESNNIIISGMLRELHEEVFISSNIKYSFYGIINDNSTEVNSVHMGICYIINLDNRECSVRETEKMEGKWVKIRDIHEYLPDMEGWSQILLNSYLKTV